MPENVVEFDKSIKIRQIYDRKVHTKEIDDQDIIDAVKKYQPIVRTQIEQIIGRHKTRVNAHLTELVSSGKIKYVMAKVETGKSTTCMPVYFTSQSVYDKLAHLTRDTKPRLRLVEIKYGT